MNDDTENTQGAEAGGNLQQRKERLEALKARRGGQPAPNRDLGSEMPRSPAQSDLTDGLFATGAGGGPKIPRKLIFKIYRMLTSTPQDDRGMVDGTKFTATGVERLMTLLRERASDTSKPGAKAADGMLQLLAASEEDQEVVGGASVTKLEQLSRRFDALKRRVRRFGRRGG